jgi:hypothetical protein
VIGSGGFTNQKNLVPEQLIADELASVWPGWTVGYEPVEVHQPLLGYVRGLGLALRTVGDVTHGRDGRDPLEPAILSYRRAPREAAAPGRDSFPAHLLDTPIDTDALSIRTSRALDEAGLTTWGQVAALSDAELAIRGLEERSRRELAEVMADLAG